MEYKEYLITLLPFNVQTSSSKFPGKKFSIIYSFISLPDSKWCESPEFLLQSKEYPEKATLVTAEMPSGFLKVSSFSHFVATLDTQHSAESVCTGWMSFSQSTSPEIFHTCTLRFHSFPCLRLSLLSAFLFSSESTLNRLPRKNGKRVVF